MHPSLFADEAVDLALVRAHPNTRWAALPPDVIPLTAAEPDFPVAPEITEAVAARVADGYFLYCSPYGEASLKEAVAQSLRERQGLVCEPAQLVPTLGTAAGMWLAVHSQCRPGDECIILDPVDLLFGMAVDSAGAKRVYCQVDKRTGRIDLEQLRSLVTPRTRLIALCNPHNPVGSLIQREELLAVGALAAERGLMILSDEVWSEIVYPPNRHVSLASLSPELAARTFTLCGPSKTFGLPGVRIGFVVAPSPKVAEELFEVSMKLGIAYGLSLLSQVAAEAAYRQCWPWRDGFVAHLEQMRDYCVERLNRIPGVSCRKPEGTFVLFPDITGLGLTSQQAAELLLEQARVAVVPGTANWFGPGAEGHIRLCFSTSKGILKESLDRIERTLTARGA